MEVRRKSEGRESTRVVRDFTFSVAEDDVDGRKKRGSIDDERAGVSVSTCSRGCKREIVCGKNDGWKILRI